MGDGQSGFKRKGAVVVGDFFVEWHFGRFRWLVCRRWLGGVWEVVLCVGPGAGTLSYVVSLRCNAVCLKAKPLLMLHVFYTDVEFDEYTTELIRYLQNLSQKTHSSVMFLARVRM